MDASLRVSVRAAIGGWSAIIAIPALAFASEPNVNGAEPALLRKIAEQVDLYGRFDGHLEVSSHDISFANNGSRFGIAAEQTLGGGFELIGRGEWSIKLGEGDSRYHLDENPSIGFGTFSSTQSSAIGTRLGFVGMSLGDYGTLTLGKQWAVYYDVSEWTDQYTVFGATGSSTYNAGTDGGQTGTGRANDAVVYRVALGPFQLGAQAQFRAATATGLDSLAGSLVYDSGFGLRVGVAYSHAFLEDLGLELVGFDGTGARAFTAGISYKDDAWVFATVNTWTRNHEIVNGTQAAVMYDTLGAELFVARKLAGRLMLYGGFDLAIPRGLDPRFVNPNYGTRDVLFGARWLFDSKVRSYAYVEGRTGASIAADGSPAPDVITLGLRLSYSLRDGLAN
jgi:predicted porin